MKIFATYNIKSGFGKTAAAVNLTYLSARSGYRTLVWDLDAQGAATYYFGVEAYIKGGSEKLLRRKRNLPKAIRGTSYENIDLIPSDFSLRNLDIALTDEKNPQRHLKKLLYSVQDNYDVVILDRAPTILLASENIIFMANWLLIPLIPTHLSLRAYEQLQTFSINRNLNQNHLPPFFSMVDRRKHLHPDLIVEFANDHPELLRTYIPYLSQIEQMGIHQAPVAGERAKDG